MSSPDYDQFSEDHQCFLVVIKSIGPQMNQKLFEKIYDRIQSQLYEIRIENSKSATSNNDFQNRIIRLRYKQSYSIENNDWGDFQAHRKLIGLITVAQSFNENELESIIELHRTIYDTYTNTLVNSKCFIVKSFESLNSESSVSNDDEKKTNNNILMIDDSDKQTVNEIIGHDCQNNNQENPNNLGSNSQLFGDFDLGGQLYISSSDHTGFTSRVNCSSSSASSITSQNSRTPSTLSIQEYNQTDELSMNSLPSNLTSNNYNEHKINQKITDRLKTHFRNKSFDSKLLTLKESDHGLNFLNDPSNRILENGFISDSEKQVHSHSSTSLFSGNESSLIINNKDTSMTEFILYDSDEQCCKEIELKTRQFIDSLFWAVESKRLNKIGEKKDKLALMMAPCEKKDLVGLDNDTRSYKRKCFGRMQKHIADLSLMVGLPQESLSFYLTAIENLKDDKLWLASAYEGLCASSLVLLFPQRWQKIHNLRYQYPFTEGVLENLLKRNDYDRARVEIQISIKQIATQHSNVEEKWMNNKNSSKNMLLTVNQFYEKYREAASNYSLYRGAAVIEFECSFKAARTLALFQRYLKASDFIGNSAFISLAQSLEEQLERLLRVSQLYESIGFYRKAAFFKRFAALRTASHNIKNHDWEKCYFLFLPALYSYGLILDPNEYDRQSNLQLQQQSFTSNWSSIHVELLQEIISTSLRMSNETMAIRHISFMLQCLFAHITPSQRQEFATKLSHLSSKCGEGSPVLLRLNNGATIPSVNFTKFPTVLYFKVEQLKPYLRPHKIKSKFEKDQMEMQQKNSGPFIYTPLQLNRSPKVVASYGENSIFKKNFYWAEGNIGSISLSLHNFLPIELNISSITLMTDGVAFEPKHDTSLKIAPNMSQSDILLTGIPRSSGLLEIIGYKLHTLGVKSDCRLSQLPNARRLKLPSRFVVEVVSRLPLMCAQFLGADDMNDEIRLIKNLKPSCDTFSDFYISSTNFISLFAGQQKTYQVKLSNISPNQDELIDLINIEIVYPKKTAPFLQKLINIEWDVQTINQLLPFGQDLPIQFDITLSACGDFVWLKKNELTSKNKGKEFNLANVSQPKKLQVFGSKKLANLINDFQSKKNTNSSEVNSTSANQQNSMRNFPSDMVLYEDAAYSNIVELCLQIEYSGGPGLNSGFCRHLYVYLAVEIKSSIMITHWDVIPSDQMDETYLVFDAFNTTSQEINLIYSQNKEMLIESKEKCRIPIPVKRCPLNLSDMIDRSKGESISDTYLNVHREKTTSFKDSSDDFLNYIFSTKQKLEAIFALCRANLMKQVSIKWTMPNTDIEGVVLVEQVPYSNEMLKLLLINPIQSEVQINSSVFHGSSGEVSSKSGEHMTIAIKLFNNSETTLRNLRLYLVYYQDYQNASLTKARNYNISSKVIINGCDSLFLNKLKTKETYLHRCGLIFLYPGTYRLDVCCLPEERFRQSASSTHNLNQETNQMEYTTNHSSNQQSQNTQNSLFKCLHTFEIAVDE